MGAAYGTAKSGVGIAAMAILKPERIMKSVIPIIMAGIVAIYGVVVAVLISGRIKGSDLTIADVSVCHLVVNSFVFKHNFSCFSTSKSIYNQICKVL